MSFYKRDSEGNIIRNRVMYETDPDEEVRVEQSHKDEVDINNIVKRHGMDLIAKTAALQQFSFDDNPNNDFQETMNAILKAQDSFSSISSEIRKRFDNDPAKFMDFIHNPDNNDELVEMGLAQRLPEPQVVQVEVVNQQTTETPPVE